MVDKLFFRGEPMALRCFFKNLPMLCPIPIGPLFYQVFYTKDGLDFSLAHGHRCAHSFRPVRPCPLFLFSSAAPFTPFDLLLFAEEGKLG